MEIVADKKWSWWATDWSQGHRLGRIGCMMIVGKKERDTSHHRGGDAEEAEGVFPTWQLRASSFPPVLEVRTGAMKRQWVYWRVFAFCIAKPPWRDKRTTCISLHGWTLGIISGLSASLIWWRFEIKPCKQLLQKDDSGRHIEVALGDSWLAQDQGNKQAS